MTAGHEGPTTVIDPFSAELARDPYGTYRDLRELGRAVWVSSHNIWLLTRYDDVRAAALDWESYSSAQGVGLLEDFSRPLVGGILASDPPRHDVLRAVLADKLAPRALGALRADIRTSVDAMVASAVDKGTFDAVSELCQRIPVTIVADLIGLPDDGREVLLPGADAVFTTFGPETPLLRERMSAFHDYFAWMSGFTDASSLRPGSWGAHVFRAVEQGRISGSDAVNLIRAFLVAGMDTTANALGWLIQVLATRADVWAAWAAAPQLGSSLFEETLRTQSPVQGFFRVATTDIRYGTAVVRTGEKVLLHFGIANRDERKYPLPDIFQIDRNPLDHLAFGYGVHACAGQGLARMEADALVAAMHRHVRSITALEEAVLHVNPVVRGLASLRVAVEPR